MCVHVEGAVSSGGGCGRLGVPAAGIAGVAVGDWFCGLPKEAMDVKKLLALAAVAGGVLFVVRRNKSAKAQDDLWREATAPAGTNNAKKA